MPQLLSARLKQDTLLEVPGVYDGLTALLAEQAGCEAAFVSGAGLAFSRFGKPDMGLVSLSELATCVSQMREATELPLIVDLDTGFGNALNVQRSVALLERCGASALQIEDQQMPKRCGHMAGKTVISANEMVGKLHAALDAREDPNTLIFARTDALGVLGFDEAMARAERYVQAGVDGLFIEAPASGQQVGAIAREFAHRIPLIHNLVKGGNSPVDAMTLADLGFAIALHPLQMLQQMIPAGIASLAAWGRNESLNWEEKQALDLQDINRIVATDSLLEIAKRYN